MNFKLVSASTQPPASSHYTSHLLDAERLTLLVNLHISSSNLFTLTDKMIISMMMMMTSSIFPAKGLLGVAWVENRLEFSNKEAVWSLLAPAMGISGETKTPEHPLLIAFCSRVNNGP